MTDLLKTCDEIEVLGATLSLKTLWIGECGDEVEAREYVLACVNAAPDLIAATRREAKLRALLHEFPDSFECLCSDGTCWACRRDKALKDTP